MSVEPDRVLRVLEPEDAETLASIWTRDREHLDPWSPHHREEFYTVAGQLELIERRLTAQAAGQSAAFAIVDDGELVGEITLTDIVRGAFQNGHVGYFLAEPSQGRGLATRAVGELKQHAFDVMGLHRLQAGTLVHNARSRAVLERNGFEEFGLAPRYLRIAGRWQDHLLFQTLAPDA